MQDKKKMPPAQSDPGTFEIRGRYQPPALPSPPPDETQENS